MSTLHAALEQIKQSHTLADLLLRFRNTATRGIYFDKADAGADFLSYAELGRVAMQVGQSLVEKGMQKKDELVFQVEDNKTFIYIFWGCLFQGIIPVPLTPGTHDDYTNRVDGVMATLSNPYIVCNAKQYDHLYPHFLEKGITGTEAAQLHKRFITDIDLDIWQQKAATEQPAIPPAGNKDDLALIQFSSGSTGHPKGVALTHGNIIINLYDIILSTAITETDSMLSWVPLTHDMGIILVHLCGVVAGIDQYLVPTEFFKRRPLKWMDKVSKFRATLLYTNNFGLRYFLTAFDETQTYSWDLSAVRLIFNAGEPVSAGLCRQFLQKMESYKLPPNAMLPCFGMAEASVGISNVRPGSGLNSYNVDRHYLNIGDQVRYADGPGAPFSTEFTDLGIVFPGVEAKICDEQGNQLPEGYIGYLHMRGPNFTAGYYNNPEDTAAVFDKEGWFNTGDIAFFKNSGLVITGRAKNVIIINGQNYYPHDIEAALETLDGLDNNPVVACGIQDVQTLEEQLVIFVVWKKTPAAFGSLADIIKKTVLQKTGLSVAHVVPVKRIPKTTSGKVRYFKLVEQFRQGEFDTLLQQAPATLPAADPLPDREQISAIIIKEVQQILYNREYSLHEPLLAGGVFNSLLVMQLASFMEARFKVTVPAKDLFDGLTIDQLTQRVLDKNQHAGAIVAGEMSSTGSIDNIMLSNAQLGLWLINQAAGEQHTAYNNLIASRVQGPFNPAYLQQAVIRMIERHEILRTSFPAGETGPRQRIHIDSTSFDRFHYKDLRQRINEVEQFIHAERDYCFDLEQGPLVRIVVLQLAEEDFICLFNLHHIISDAWSARVIFHELTQLYESIQQQKVANLLPVTTQYRHYTIAQQQWLEGEQAAASRQFWLNYLAGPSPAIQLPFAASRPVSKTWKGSATQGTITGPLFLNLQKLCRQYQASCYMVLLTAVNTLLYRYTGMPEITIGTPFYGRTTPGMQEQMGSFINTLPVRTKMNGNTSFRQLVHHVKLDCLAIYDHQEYPLDLLVRDLQIERDNSRSPLFDIIVEFNSRILLQKNQPAFSGSRVQPQEYEKATSMFDLDFEFDEHDDHIHLRLHFNTDLFRKEDAENIIVHFGNLLQAALETPEAPVQSLNYLSAEDQQSLLRDSEGLQRAYDLSRTYIDYFRQQVAANPGKTVLICGHDQYTLAALDRLSDEAAKYILQQEQHTGPGHLVAVFLDRSPAFVIWVLAIWKTGAAYVPIDPALPQERILHMMELSGAGILISHQDLLEARPALRTATGHTLVDIAAFDKFHSANEENVPLAQTSPTDLAYVLFTSGSTGEPKGVMIEQAGMMNHMLALIEYFTIGSNTRIAQTASQSFDISVWQFFTGLITEAVTYIYPQSLIYHPAKLLTAVCEDGINLLELVPSYLSMIIEAGTAQQYDLSKLAYLIVTGEEIKPALVQKAVLFFPTGTALINAYGPAEASDDVSFHRITAQDAQRAVVPVGVPLPNCQVYVLDEADNPCARYVRGEIAVGGICVGRGYINQPTLTAQSFKKGFNNERLYMTGDTGYIDRQGLLFFTGRKDHQVKIRGQRIEIGEIENRLLQIAGVEEAVVMVTGEAEEAKIIAFTAGTRETDTGRIRAYLVERLPAYMVPALFFHPGRLPHNANGKIDRNALLQLTTVDSQLQPLPAADMDKLETALAGLWEKALGKPVALHPGANFFEAGGHSMAAMQLSQHILINFGVRITLASLFRYQQFEQQVVLIKAAQPVSMAHIPRLGEGTDAEVLADQQRFLAADEWEKGTYTNNAVGGAWLDGIVDTQLLQQAIQLLTERYEVLRSAIHRKDNKYVFTISDADAVDCTLRQIDITGYEDIDARLAAVARTEAEFVFDITRLPICRWMLVETAPQRRVLLVTMHHIMADGASLIVLARELANVYQNLAAGQPPFRQPLSIQYKDYAAWFNDKVIQEQHNDTFWKQYLRPPLPVLNLAVDLNGNRDRLNPSRVVMFTIEKKMFQAAASLARQERTTLFSLLLSVIHTLLYQRAGADDLLVAIPVVGRTHPQLEDQVGFFLHILLLRSQVGADTSFRQLLQNMSKNLADVLDHEMVTYEHYTDQLGLHRPGRAGLYDLMVMHQQVHFGSQGNRSFTIRPYIERMFEDRTDCDLRFDLIEYEDSITVGINYNANLFEEQSIRILEYSFMKILELAVTQAPDTTIGEMTATEMVAAPALINDTGTFIF